MATKKINDPELAAMNKVATALEPLTAEQQIRVLGYYHARVGQAHRAVLEKQAAEMAAQYEKRLADVNASQEFTAKKTVITPSGVPVVTSALTGERAPATLAEARAAREANAQA